MEAQGFHLDDVLLFCFQVLPVTAVTTALSFLTTPIQTAVSHVLVIQTDLSTSFATLSQANANARAAFRVSSVTPALLAPMARGEVAYACPATAVLLVPSRARCVTL